MFKIIHKIKFSTVIYIILALFISWIGYRLRIEKFYFFPPLGDTSDETKAPFNGLSLLNLGVPRSWSWFPQYTNASEQKIRGTNYRLVQPWFDEPPLFSLMMGVYAKEKGINQYGEVDAGVFRWVMIKFAALNTFLLFVILFMLGKPIVGLAASAIYATVPTMVLGSRMPISDNMVGTFALLSVFLLLLYTKSKSKLALCALILLSSSTLLLKSTGIFVPMGIMFILLGLKDFKAAIFQIIGIGVMLGIWFGYGYYYDWNTFLKIMEVSSGRELFAPGNMISLFLVYRIGESIASVDGWLLWGWLAVVVYSYIFVSDKSKSPLERLILPCLLGSYLVFFSIMSGHNKGWYRFPFFPFLAWAGAELIVDLIKKPKFLAGLFFIGVPLASSYIFGTGEYKFTNPQIRQFQYFFIAITGILMAKEINLHPVFLRAAQLLMLIAFVAAIIFNYRTIMFYQDQFWYQ